jgi:hypothetical protein
MNDFVLLLEGHAPSWPLAGLDATERVPPLSLGYGTVVVTGAVGKLSPVMFRAETTALTLLPLVNFSAMYSFSHTISSTSTVPAASVVNDNYCSP